MANQKCGIYHEYEEANWFGCGILTFEGQKNDHGLSWWC